MLALANFLIALGMALNAIVYFFLITTLIRAVVSWVNADPYNPMVRFLIASTEPLMKPIRRIIPPLGGSLDLSPLILIIVLMFLDQFIGQSLIDYGHLMKSGI